MPYDLGIEHFYQFVTEDGQLDVAKIIAPVEEGGGGYSEGQVETIRQALAESGKLKEAPKAEPEPEPESERITAEQPTPLPAEPEKGDA